MEKSVQLILTSKTGFLFDVYNIWVEKGKNPIWICYEAVSISDDKKAILDKEIEKSEYFYCLIRMKNGYGIYPSGDIYHMFKAVKIVKTKPSDEAEIIKPSWMDDNDIKFYVKIINIEKKHKLLSEYVTIDNKKITREYLRKPPLVVEKDEDEYN